MTSYIEILKILLRQQSFLDYISIEEIASMRSVSKIIKTTINERLIITRDDTSIDVTYRDNRLFKMKKKTRLLSINPFGKQSSLHVILEPQSIFTYNDIGDQLHDVSIVVRDCDNDRSILFNATTSYGTRVSYDLKKINNSRYSGIHIMDIATKYNPYIVIQKIHYFIIDDEFIEVDCDDNTITFYKRLHELTIISIFNKRTKIIDGDISSSILTILDILKNEDEDDIREIIQ